jgi:deoxyribonuclease IV
VRFGFHVSIAGGFGNVLERAREIECETIQFFSSNPRGWSIADLDPDDVAKFRSDMEDSGISPTFVHAPYIPNLAGAGAEGKRSVKALVTQVERCKALGVPFLVCHTGKAMGADEKTAIARIVKNVNSILAAAPEGVTFLLENTAGMGTEVGYKFEQLAEIIGKVKKRERVGITLDTAHSFEAGYEFRTKAGIDATLREFDRLVGISRLHLLHLNDSKTEFGSRVDRHWHIGEGKLGREGMGQIINHPLLKNMPAVMETPQHTEKMNLKNMRAARSLVRTDESRCQKLDARFQKSGDRESEVRSQKPKVKGQRSEPA